MAFDQRIVPTAHELTVFELGKVGAQRVSDEGARVGVVGAVKHQDRTGDRGKGCHGSKT